MRIYQLVLTFAYLLSVVLLAANPAIAQSDNVNNPTTLAPLLFKHHHSTPEEIEKRREEGRLFDLRLATLQEKGEALFKEHRYKEAIAAYEEARKLLDLDEIYAALSDCYRALGDMDSAVTQYRCAVYRSTPARLGNGTPKPEYRLRYVLLLCDANRTAEAVAEYEKAMPDFARTISYHQGVTLTEHFNAENFSVARLRAAAHLGIGIRLSMLQDSEKALIELREVIRTRPDMAVAYFYMGYALQNMGKHLEANTYYQIAFDQGRGNLKRAAAQ